MEVFSSFVARIALLSVCSTVLAAGTDVTFQTPVYNPGMPVSTTGVGDPVCVQGDGLLVSSCDVPGTGAFSKFINAMTCKQADNPDNFSIPTCVIGNTVRTDGSDSIPCFLRGALNNLRTTYLCEVDLPTGTLINKVTAYGHDTSATGYFEAAIWRVPSVSGSAVYISPAYGGTWQSSGIVDEPAVAVFPIYTDSDAPHPVIEDNRYVIGFAIKGTLARARGFRIDYTILP